MKRQVPLKLASPLKRRASRRPAPLESARIPYYRKRAAQQLYLKIEVNKSSAQVDGAQQLWKINHRRLQVTRSPEARRLPFRCPTSRPAASPACTHNSLRSGCFSTTRELRASGRLQPAFLRICPNFNPLPRRLNQQTNDQGFLVARNDERVSEGGREGGRETVSGRVNLWHCIKGICSI